MWLVMIRWRSSIGQQVPLALLLERIDEQVLALGDRDLGRVDSSEYGEGFVIAR